MKNTHANHRATNHATNRGFSLLELAATIMILSMLGMAMGPTLKQMRSTSQGIASAANLQAIGQGAAMYAKSNNGRMFSYSWRAGETYIMPDGKARTEGDDSAAAIRQETEILMRRTGRISGEFKIKNAAGRIPHRRFTHLVLNDFLNIPLEDTTHIDPADTNQLFWHANPLDNRLGSTVPYANGDVPAGYDTSTVWTVHSTRQRWAFASSYQNVPSAWQQDTPNPRWLPVESTPHLFTTTSGTDSIDLSTGRYMSELLFPAHKVWLFEEFDREAEGNPYFAYDHARSEKLMFDGSVNNWQSGDAYPSIIPEHGFPYSVWEQTYIPLDTFPIPLAGLGDNTRLNQRYRWTFRGLLGVDYGPSDPDGR
jgi:prepilin-type N-terminal cleavage/methylation domain-containing protein